MANLLGMIHKRHDGPGWLVVEELPNSTGTQSSRRADAFAMGLWPSRGFETHLYEIKRSRSDVQKELLDVSKADAVGKYADYIWLVVEDLKIIDGLVIPAAWGILAPKNNVLRVNRKAPKREATAFTRGFAAAIIRAGLENTIPKSKFEEYKTTARDTLRGELERDRKYQREDEAHQLEALQKRVKVFEDASGISLADPWKLGELGEVVRLVLRVRELAGSSRNSHWRGNVEQVIEMEISGLLARAERSQATADQFRETVEQLRRFAGSLPAMPMNPTDPPAPPEEAAEWARTTAGLLDGAPS